MSTAKQLKEEKRQTYLKQNQLNVNLIKKLDKLPTGEVVISINIEKKHTLIVCDSGKTYKSIHCFLNNEMISYIEFKTFEKMEELEFKHVAHRYLPYGLQCIYKGKRQELINLHYFYSYDENGEIAGKSLCTRVSDPDLNDIQCLITAAIPLLRPISDSEKGMEIEKLLEGHFDVFNLIGTNRAVSY